MDCAFLHPNAIDWSPGGLVLDLYPSPDASVPTRVNLMEFMAGTPDLGKMYHAKDARVYTFVPAIA